MFAGLDFGTSSSALGTWSDNQVNLLPLYKDEKFLPSTLYTLDRNLICDYLYRNLTTSHRAKLATSRAHNLQRASNTRRDLDIRDDDPYIFFGKQAIENYTQNPAEGVFIKSPKSFLGATGLSPAMIAFFEDLVSAMMLNIKLTAEQTTQQAIESVVIGRPVNFQGVNSEKSNQQAIEIMTNAAINCGYKHIEFLFEPLAAGVDFETSLTADQLVLVIDIGGGTTDCSMVKMGPSFVEKSDRSADFLAHSGQRIGGNDLDINLAFHTLMPLFGRGGFQKKGIQLPNAPYWSAVSINDVNEQSMFASDRYVRDVQALRREAVKPDLIDRLLLLQASKQNHRLVRVAELGKIALSDSAQCKLDLSFIKPRLSQKIDHQIFETSVKRPLLLIEQLIQESIKQAGVNPEVVYITGGTAKSPAIRQLVNRILPDVAILDGDYYGSVAAGLTKWAKKIWGNSK